MAKQCDTVVFAWGSWGDFINERVELVKKMFPNAFCYHINNDGQPKHPLYTKKTDKIRPFIYG